MQIENIYEFAIYGLKTIALVVALYLLFSLGLFVDKKFNQLLPKLPKFLLYILIVIFAAIWLLAKLLKFGVLKT